MKKFALIVFATFSMSVFAEGQSPLVGAWWFVNSNVVNVIEQLNETELLSKNCETKEYLQTQKCSQYGTVTHYRLLTNTNHACSVETQKLSDCWYLIQATSSTDSRDTLYVKADARNTMPGVGYALSAKRLRPGQWPMKN